MPVEYEPKRSDLAVAAEMLGLPKRYAKRGAYILQLMDAPVTSKYRIIRPIDVFEHVRYMGALRKEHLVGLYLNSQNAIVCKETISIGSLNTTRTTPREILYPAILSLANGYILVHNHPSQSLDPSDEDVSFTKAVHRASEVLGIELYDHIIVTKAGFTSLRERGAI